MDEINDCFHALDNRLEIKMTQQQHVSPSRNQESLYGLVGGENGLSNLIKNFYDIIETDPASNKLLLLHLRGQGVANSRLEQFNFLSGFLGGPKLYIEKHGHANVKFMHEHIEIDREVKDIWLKCMSTAIDETGLVTNTKDRLMSVFTLVADRLVNH